MGHPEFIEIDGKKLTTLELMLRPCSTKKDLHNWIKTFLGLDFPDCIVCEESTASPMDMIWNTYRAAMENDFSESSQLYFASRDSMKTLGAAIIELLFLIHHRRTATHMGAIKSQSKKCYDYFRDFLNLPLLDKIPRQSETMEHTELNIKNEWNIKPSLHIVICTMQGANSSHSNLHVIDEIETVEDVRAYHESKKIPTETPDKKTSITLYISTRKSNYGLVQYEIDRAKESNLKVRSWNIIDVTQACPKEKSRMDRDMVVRYFNESKLSLISEEEFNNIELIQQSEWVRKEMYPGCVNCTISPLCLGRLATKQTSTSRLLKSHNDVEKKFRESELDDALAQLMCLRASTHGLVFTTFDQRKNVVTPTQMWEIFTGSKAPSIISKDELIETFKQYNVPCFTGLDWGWDDPSVAIFIYIDKADNIYVVQEFSVTHTDDAEFIEILKRRFHTKFNVQMYYPDSSNPSGINLLKKAGLGVSTKKLDKSIHLGIQTIKRFIRIPGTNQTKFYVLDDCSGLLNEINKYHLKLDSAGLIIASDEYDDKFNHRIDSLRYVIHNRLARFSAMIESGEIPKDSQTMIQNSEGNFVRSPTVTEYAKELGIPFNDNRDLVEKQQKKEQLGDKYHEKDSGNGGESGGSNSGFSWSF